MYHTMTSYLYTEVELRRLKGQAVKDIWHEMIGKPPGVKNTTGLKSGEDVLHAILQAQSDPTFLAKFRVRTPKPSVYEEVEEREMPPPKKKPGPKPSSKSKGPPLVVIPVQQTKAIESTEAPLPIHDVKRITVHSLLVNDVRYFLDAKTKTVYVSTENRPGEVCGTWDPKSRVISYDDCG